MHGRRLPLTRPVDRGLLAAARAELRAVVPPGRTPIRPTVRVDVAETGVVAAALVRWKVGKREVGFTTSVTESSTEDPANVALAYLLGRLERTRTGTTRPLGPAVLARFDPRKKARSKVELAPPAKKAVARTGGQLARGTDPALRDEVAALLDARIPDGATETGRTLDLYALKPGVYRAAVVLSFRTPRGKRDVIRAEATGRGEDAPGARRCAAALSLGVLERCGRPRSGSTCCSAPTSPRTSRATPAELSRTGSVLDGLGGSRGPT